MLQVLLVLLILCPKVVIAQTDSWDRVTSLQPGQRVFVTHARQFTEGALVRASPDSIAVRTAQQEVSVPRADVRKVAIPAHRRARNAIIGAAIGVAAMLGPAVFLRERLNNETGNGDQVAVATIVIGAGAGAGLGSLSPGRTTIYQRK